uniref:BPTI/Kunitz inhibitor domain-containing protein n=1 Tax=Acanthochromis polyacanthus TaxID=80966 RepID=A0A3Q1GZK7_9TELE
QICEQSLLNVCVLLSARCQLDSDSGIQCADFVRVWFFDKHIGACSPFWYGGCGGNANRFNTEHECFRTCVAHSKVRFPSSPASVFTSNLTVSSPFCSPCLYTDACLLSQDQGGCQNYTMMWFFDTEQNECSRFWYGGCGGNKNRFKTQEECENLYTAAVLQLAVADSYTLYCLQGNCSVSSCSLRSFQSFICRKSCLCLCFHLGHALKH